MLTWLKWLVAGREMETLHRYRTAINQADRWLASFPDAVDTLAHVKSWGEGNGGETRDMHVIEKVRERMGSRRERVRKFDEAFAIITADVGAPGWQSRKNHVHIVVGSGETGVPE